MDLTCEDLLIYLSDYIDNNLEDELVAAAREHLATCHNCRVVLNTTQKTITLISDEEKQVIPTERREKLFASLQAAFEKK